jgi:hypothetical protein
LGAALALALAAPACAQALYAPPEGDFTVAFPAQPTVQVKPAKRSHDITFRRYVDQEASRAFVVAVDQYPDGSLPQLVDAGVYDHILRDRAGDDPTRLVSTRPARLAGKPCLEGTFRQPDGDIEVVRVLMVGDTLYQLTFAHPEGVDATDAASAFFNSFRIKPAG